jgi:phospholipid/cholesterol/gamma-HCH transport system substrate-binding protein
METRANYVAVGGFVLTCMIGIVVALLWLAGHQYRQAYTYYATKFSGSVTGLGTGTLVRYNGIDVGRVMALDFDKDNPALVAALLEVRADLTIRQDASASIEMQGLTGAAYVEITGGSAKSPPLEVKDGEAYPFITSKPSSLQQLFANTPALMAKFSDIADRLSDLLNDNNRAAVADTLANVRDTTGVLARRSAELDQMLTELSKASKELDVTLGDLHGILGKADGAVDGVDRTLASADAAAKRLAQLGGDLDDVVKGSKTELEDATGEGMTQLTALLGEMRTLVGSLTRLSSELEHEPTKLLFGDRREGYSPK